DPSYLCTSRPDLQVGRAEVFHVEMTTSQRGHAAGFQIVDQLRTTFRRRGLVPVLVVHHDHRRAVAGAEAFELEQRAPPRRVGLARLADELLAERLGAPLGAGERA